MAKVNSEIRCSPGKVLALIVFTIFRNCGNQTAHFKRGSGLSGQIPTHSRFPGRTGHAGCPYALRGGPGASGRRFRCADH